MGVRFASPPGESNAHTADFLFPGGKGMQLAVISPREESDPIKTQVESMLDNGNLAVAFEVKKEDINEIEVEVKEMELKA